MIHSTSSTNAWSTPKHIPRMAPQPPSDLSSMYIGSFRGHFLDISILYPGSTSDCLAFEGMSPFQKLEGGILAPGLCIFGDNAYLNTPLLAAPLFCHFWWYQRLLQFLPLTVANMHRMRIWNMDTQVGNTHKPNTSECEHQEECCTCYCTCIASQLLY